MTKWRCDGDGLRFCVLGFKMGLIQKSKNVSLYSPFPPNSLSRMPMSTNRPWPAAWWRGPCPPWPPPGPPPSPGWRPWTGSASWPIRCEHRGHVTRSPPIPAHLGGQAGALLAGGWRSGGASQGWLSNWSVKKRFPVEDLLSAAANICYLTTNQAYKPCLVFS